jgi:simple sugar transport system permease protein
MAIETASATKSDERLAQAGIVRGFFRRVEVGALIGAVVIWVFFAIVAPDIWLTITGVSGMLAVRGGWNIWLAMLAALVFAAGVGYFNGWMVTKTRLPSFIVTLATFFILRGANVGVTKLVTDRIVVEGIDKAAGFYTARLVLDTEFKLLGATFRTSTIWWIVLTLIAAWVLQRTKFGNWIFAVGGDAQAARNVGVPSNRVKITLFMTTAIAGWLVGMMNIVRLRSAVASQGIGEEFVYIICAVIGGSLLTGGYGSALGAAIGAIIFGMVRVGIVFAGWDTDWFYSFLGIMLLVAVLVNDNTRRRAESVSVAAAKARTEEVSKDG